MELSIKERWVLSNQYKILELLDQQNASYYAEIREAIECGYEGEYTGLVENIYSDKHIMTKENCQFVIEVLDMFSELKRGYDGLKDKTEITDWKVNFRGFDGNNETKYMGYARYLLKRGSFPELDIKNINSHSPSIGRYREMLEKWKLTSNPHELSKADIITIIS